MRTAPLDQEQGRWMNADALTRGTLVTTRRNTDLVRKPFTPTTVVPMTYKFSETMTGADL